MTAAWRDLLSSKKFWTAILAVITLIASKKGIEIDSETFWAVAAIFTALIGAQGLTDHGKSRGDIAAPALPTAPPASPVPPAPPPPAPPTLDLDPVTAGGV